MAAIPTAVTRKAAFDAAVAAAPTAEAAAAARNTALADHSYRVITNWASASDANSPVSRQNELKLNVVTQLDAATLDAWDAELTGKGYTVVRDAMFFTVTLPA